MKEVAISFALVGNWMGFHSNWPAKKFVGGGAAVIKV